MPNQSDNRKQRRSNVIPLATPPIEQTAGDPLFEQPLIEGADDSAIESPGRKGGKARAKKLGKAKLSAIAKKVTRSRWKKAR